MKIIFTFLYAHTYVSRKLVQINNAVEIIRKILPYEYIMSIN